MIHLSAKFVLIALCAGALARGEDNGTFTQEARRAYREAATNVLKSAEVMGAEDYGFRPAASSRTFGELIAESIRSQGDVCSAIAGKELHAAPPRGNTKPELLDALRNSDKSCDDVYASIGSFTASATTEFGGKRQSKLSLMFLNTARNREIYGSLAVYLRMKGLTPPSAQSKLIPLD